MIQGAFESDLTLIQKYQILELFMDGEETPRGQHPAQEADPSEFVEHEGKMYRQVAISGQDGTFYMDEEKHIYDSNFENIGEACDDSD